MAKPISSTELDEKDFMVLLHALENPRVSPKATEMYNAGKTIHDKMHKKNPF